MTTTNVAASRGTLAILASLVIPSLATNYSMRPKQIVDNIVVWHFTNRVRYVQTCVNIFLRPVSGYNSIIIMSEKDIARQVLRGYIDREIDLENQLKEILNRRKSVVVEEGDFFKIRREQMEKQKKIAKKRNETFLKDLEHATAKLRASLACDDLTDKKLDNERKKFTDYVRQTRREQSV